MLGFHFEIKKRRKKIEANATSLVDDSPAPSSSHTDTHSPTSQAAHPFFILSQKFITIVATYSSSFTHRSFFFS